MFVVVTGDSNCFGPFGTEEAATIWATKRFGDDEEADWEVVPLQPSSEED